MSTDMQLASPFQAARDVLQKNATWILVYGIVMTLIGIGAILVPFVATITVEILVACALFAGGVIELIHAVSIRRWQGFLWGLLAGAASILIGALMLIEPLTAIIALTYLLAAFFLAEGVLKFIAAIHLRGKGLSAMLGLTGAVSIILAIIIFANMPGMALWAIGLLVGINLLFRGMSLVALASAVRGGRAIDPVAPPAETPQTT